MLNDLQDAFGHEIYDHFRGQGGYEIVERDDGFFSLSPGPQLYLLDYEAWPACEQEAMAHVQGRVLDIGCGAGRHSLYLQGRGFEVVGIDTSPLAIEVCRARGLRQTHVLSVTQVTSRLGTFDTLVMLGNNFALVGHPKRARWLLRRFYRATSGAARIIAQTRDPYQTEVPEHLTYHARNREQGRWSGEVRIRVRYKRFVTPWICFLMTSKAEMQALLEGTGWEVTRFIDGAGGAYVAVMEKQRI
jgi:SAM-dependent methyltransferase